MEKEEEEIQRVTMEERKMRRERRLEEFEKMRHRLPPFIVLPLPGPFKHVRLLLSPLPYLTTFFQISRSFVLPSHWSWRFFNELINRWLSYSYLSYSQYYLHGC